VALALTIALVLWLPAQHAVRKKIWYPQSCAAGSCDAWAEITVMALAIWVLACAAAAALAIGVVLRRDLAAAAITYGAFAAIASVVAAIELWTPWDVKEGGGEIVLVWPAEIIAAIVGVALASTFVPRFLRA
jgi:hypothetical protein